MIHRTVTLGITGKSIGRTGSYASLSSAGRRGFGFAGPFAHAVP
jgi:hypothetical protein